ncbi:MAG: His/Gly/Thr/Pro-type tRNA ligase C-terminal domain-containing protein [Mycoplasmoidaceae bacterium]|nr:His/Gly/Thr/Pro-type tRNA ligase C-terminal domain-containing protein [Mycoplasmoidaceae bacterium]
MDPETNQRFIPHVVEPSVGVERLFYAIICDNYNVEKLDDGETREVLTLPYDLCPYKVAVLPLSNKLNEQAKKVFDGLISKHVPATFDVTGSIGKRYRRQDAIGTYYCITYDFDSEKDHCVTIRNRDTMKQERIKISEILNYLNK